MNEGLSQQLKEELIKFSEEIISYFTFEEYQKLNLLLKDDSRLSNIIKRYLTEVTPILNERRAQLALTHQNQPDHFETVYQLGALCQLMGDGYQALDYYQLALKNSPSIRLRQEIITRLETQFQLRSDQIPIIVEEKVMQLIADDQVLEAVQFLNQCEGIDPAYQAELDYFAEQEYLQIFIIRLLFNCFQGYPIQEVYGDYLNAQIYFAYRYYHEALLYYEKLDESFMSPLCLRHLSYLYQATQQFEKADAFYERYLKSIKEERYEG